VYKQNFKPARTVHRPKLQCTSLDVQSRNSTCLELESPPKDTHKRETLTPEKTWTLGDSNSDSALLHQGPKNLLTC